MSNRFYNENVEKFMSEESKYSDTQIEEIKTKILAALETVIDPELGIDIINLGLVYEISFEDNGFTEVKMTLTTMGCPLADVLTDQIHDALKEVEEVTKVNCYDIAKLKAVK